jgi:hypothetical protein
MKKKNNVIFVVNDNELRLCCRIHGKYRRPHTWRSFF